MRVDIGRYASSIFRSTLLYLASVMLVFGSVSFAVPEFMGQVAYAATTYNGNVAGIITTNSGVVSGNLTGDYTLAVAGNVTSYVSNVATFVGTVSGDINGSVNAQINDNGVDTLSGFITGTDATDPVRIIGTFPQTGENGEFVGQIITGPTPILVDSITINGEGGIDTVEQDDNLQMVASILPVDAENKSVAWSVWWDSANINHGEATIDVNTGVLTGEDQGVVTVIAKSLDGSLKAATKTVTVVEPTDHFAPVVGAVEVVDNSASPMVDYNPYAKGDKKIRVRASVVDNQGDVQSGIDEDSCEITKDGITWVSGTYNSTTGKCYGIIAANTFTDGQVVNTFNVRVSDEDGNIGTGTAASRTVDSVAPVLGSVSVSPSYVDNMAGSVHVESDVTENVSGVTCEQRYWFNLGDGDSSDDWSNWVATDYQDGKCQLNIGGLTNGRVYEFEMRATDSVGHASNVTSSGPYIVDDTKPVVTFVDPTPQDGIEVFDNNQTFAVETDDDVEVCTIDLGMGSGTFEDGTLDGWETGGNATWQISTDSASGSYSARSGGMSGWDGVSSWISRTVDVPYDTYVNFYWKVSSEGSYDYLTFYIDGVPQNAISGVYDWNYQSFSISAGSHTITWVYSKDGSITGYSDSGWIDNITIGGVDLGFVNSDMTNNGDGIWSFGPVTLPEGVRNYTVTCVDHVGNSTTTQERSVTVDTVHPAVPELDAPDDGDATSESEPWFSWFAAENAAGYVFQLCSNNPDSEDGCDEVLQENTSSTDVYLEDINDGTYWWRVLSVDYTGDQSGWSEARSIVIDQTAPGSQVDVMPEYKNTEKFDVNITVDDHGSDVGIKYVELWYRKDGNSCPVASDIEFSSQGWEGSDDCVDGYVKYTGGSESSEFNPLTPIEFDTSLTGGDGFYEFFSIAVDWVDNRESYPYAVIVTGRANLNQQIVEEDEDSEEVSIVADTSTTVDTVAPAITLIGSANMTIQEGDSFTDPGAITDDGSEVVVTGSVKNDTPGTYMITYSATDKAGNIAVSVIRTVKVNAAPTEDDSDEQNIISYVPVTVDNGGNGSETDNSGDNDSEVKGISDVKDEDSSNDWQDAIFLGLAWYWWVLILAAVGGGGWWFLFGRNRQDEN